MGGAHFSFFLLWGGLCGFRFGVVLVGLVGENGCVWWVGWLAGVEIDRVLVS